MDYSKNLRAIAYVSFVYGGFLVITYLAFCYSALWRHEFLPIFPETPREAPRFAPSPAVGALNASINATAFAFRAQRLRSVEEPLAIVLSPQAIAVLLTGLLLVVNGYFLFLHFRRKEQKEIKRFVTSSLLTDDEKTVYDELVKCGGEATQKQLSLTTGFSAVKTYRVLKRLEAKKVVKSYPYGMTNKIILNEA
ncbi:MAG: hypothetical protein QW343_03120 [Candidatus Norongarragalinales archaeon]